MEGLPVWKLSAIIGGNLLVVFLVRQLLLHRLIEPQPVPSQSTRLFFLDYGLLAASGVGAGMFNVLILGFPLSSGLKIVFGFLALGLIPALDLSLDWEYRILRRISGTGQDGDIPQVYYPQTRKFVLLAGSTAIFLAASLLLVLSRDVFWLMGQSHNTEALGHLFQAIVWEVVFVMGTFLGLTMLAVFSYARNLRLLFGNQTTVLELVSQGHLLTKVPVVTNDEFAVIAGHTNAMIDHLLEREKMSKGLGLASEIQANLLPKASPLLPGIQVVGASLFCDETGGDFYDFLVRDGEDGRELVVMVGDGSGHGVGSALLMTSVRAYIKAHLEHVKDLAAVLNATNAMICRDVAGSGNFITVFLFAYCPSSRRGRWVGAGHNPGVFLASDGSVSKELQGRDIPLGVDARWQYGAVAEVLPPGILLLATDGLWEAMDTDKAMFGKERVNGLLAANAHAGPQQILDEIFKEVEAFTATAQVDDDRTVVIVRLD